MMQRAPTSRDVNQRPCQGHDIKGIKKIKPTRSKNRYFESWQSLIGQTTFKGVKMLVPHSDKIFFFFFFICMLSFEES